MGERLPCKQEVTSSTLVFSTWQQKLLKIKYSSLAQSVEHSAVNRSVVGSSPTGGVYKTRKRNVYGFYFFLIQRIGLYIQQFLRTSFSYYIVHYPYKLNLILNNTGYMEA